MPGQKLTTWRGKHVCIDGKMQHGAAADVALQRF